MALGLTQPLTEMSTRNISWGGKGGRCIGLTTLIPSCVDCPEILGSSTSWNTQGLSRPVMGLLQLSPPSPHWVGRDSDFLLAGRSGDRIPVGKNIFPLRPELLWGPPILPQKGYRVIPESKAAGAWQWPPTHSSAKVKERVELYLYSPCVFWGWTLPLHLSRSTCNALLASAQFGCPSALVFM